MFFIELMYGKTEAAVRSDVTSESQNEHLDIGRGSKSHSDVVALWVGTSVIIFV